MKQHTLLILSALLILSLSCQLINQISLDETIPDAVPTEKSTQASAPPTDTPQPPTETPVLPSATPPPPSDTPPPSPIPTSEPFVLEDEAFEADVTQPCDTEVLIQDYDDSVFSYGLGKVSMIDGQFAFWCYGARHTWIGTIEYEDYTFTSDENDPMQFMVVEDIGYNFIGGVGTVTYPDGSQVDLYRPTKISGEPPSPPEGVMGCLNDEGKPPEFFPVESPYISHQVRIDGEIEPDSEWSGAFCADFRLHEGINYNSTNTKRARWLVQNDSEFVYFLARVPKDPALLGVVVDYFWPRYTGTWAHSDGVFASIAREPDDLANWDETQWYDDVELDPPGTVDVEVAVSEDDEFYWLEIQKPLDSGDRYDWSLKPGQTIGHNPDDNLLVGLIFEGRPFYSRYIQLRLGEP